MNTIWKSEKFMNTIWFWSFKTKVFKGFVKLGQLNFSYLN